MVEDDHQNVFLYSKGADSVMFLRCSAADEAMVERTRKHVTEFARLGSRTLVMAYKPLSREDYESFESEFKRAEMSLDGRHKRIEECFAKLENDMTLLGCTAVEDQMQDGVPMTVLKLKEAEIKIIMLTGLLECFLLCFVVWCKCIFPSRRSRFGGRAFDFWDLKMFWVERRGVV